MIETKNRNLFPKNEEWATGDEALDLKLAINLNLCFDQLSYQSISDFYFLARAIKPRAYNPLFNSNIDLVTKALLAYLLPDACNNEEFKKIKGKYFERKICKLEIEKQDIIIDGLKLMSKFRYENQIDFYLEKMAATTRNPFVTFPVKNSEYELLVKIMFKDLTRYLKEEIEKGPELVFIKELRGGKNVLNLQGFGEFWFHEDQIYAINNL